MKSEAHSLGMIITARRKELGYSQDVVSYSAKISRRHYADIEKGRKNASLVMFRRIAKALDMKLQHILNKLDVMDMRG